MHPNDIYALTSQGEAQLRNSATDLSAAEIDLLVRFDGVLTMEQVINSLSPEARASFSKAFGTLRDRQLVVVAQPDPFTLTWNAEMSKLARTVGKAEADAGLSSLQRAGFFVQIARERTPPRPRQPGQTLTAVVIEDEPTLARFTTSLLQLSGFEVRQAGNRAEVVAEIRRPPVPDLILLDVMLPDADGFDILNRVRQHPVLKDVPVIMLTGKATREAVIRGISLGADGYITKPCTPDAVLRAVRTVLGLPEEGDAGVGVLRGRRSER